MEQSLSKDMFVDILSFKESKDIFSDCPYLADLGLSDLIPICEELDGKKGGLPTFPLTQVVIYIVLLYSRDTFLDARKYSLNDRKLQAAQYAGFPKNDNNEFYADVKKRLIRLEDDNIRSVIHKFMRKNPLSSDLWRMLVVREQNVYDLENNLFAYLDSSEKSGPSMMRVMKTKMELNTQFEQMVELKNQTIRKFYQDHSDLLKAEHTKRIADTIEQIAR